MVRALPAAHLCLSIPQRDVLLLPLGEVSTRRHAKLWPDVSLPRLVCLAARRGKLHGAAPAEQSASEEASAAQIEAS